MPQRPLLPLSDYQRIYQVIYSVLESSRIARTHRACLFFASVGAVILRDHYGLPATISAGTMALMVDEEKANVVVYGRDTGSGFEKDQNAFHAWVECGGWLIDFMSPVLGVALREDGIAWNIPRRMLQKPLAASKASFEEIQHVGEFLVRHDETLTAALLDGQGVLFEDLARTCQIWFRRPPKVLKAMGLASNEAVTQKLVLRAPSINGVW